MPGKRLPKQTKEVFETECDCARALSVVGDRWTLLIMNELSMGVRKFEEIQANTGMSSHLLSTRLQRMTQQGLIERRPYSVRPVRHEYFATQKGKELDPVILALRAWSLKWDGTTPYKEPAFQMTHKKTGELIDSSWRIPKGVAFTFDDVNGALSTAFEAERQARRAAFYAAKQRTKGLEIVAPVPRRVSKKPSSKAAPRSG